MTREDIIAAAQKFYSLAMSDVDSLIAEGGISSDFVLENYLPSIIPFGGKFEGQDGLLTYLSGFDGAIDITDFNITEMLVDGQKVTVTGSETSKVIPTGKVYKMDWVHILHINDSGQICYLHEYNDTAVMQTAFQVNL